MKANPNVGAVTIDVGRVHSRVVAVGRVAIVVDRGRVGDLALAVDRAMTEETNVVPVLVDLKIAGVLVVVANSADPGRRIAATIIAIKDRDHRRSRGNKWCERKCCPSRLRQLEFQNRSSRADAPVAYFAWRRCFSSARSVIACG